MDTAREYLCPDTTIDWLGNHSATCKQGGDVVSRHNRLSDLVLELYLRPHQVVRMKKGNGLTPEITAIDDQLTYWYWIGTEEGMPPLM